MSATSEELLAPADGVHEHVAPVAGGLLRYGTWGGGDAGDEQTVLALHGITSNHVAFAALARELSAYRLVTPDLRGRAGSNGLPGPFGMAAHADDLAALLDSLGVDRVCVLGHSMGAFVALVLAHRHPDRVQRLVLVDGGLPLPVPDGLDEDALLQAVIGPAAERLAMRFPSVEAHREFWRAHPAFADCLTTDVERYVDYDLTGQPPELRPSASYEAVRDDSTDLHTGSAFAEAVSSLQHPAVFLRAERGMLDQPGGLYPAEAAATAVAALPGVVLRTVPGVNHYTVVMSQQGAAQVADAVRHG